MLNNQLRKQIKHYQNEYMQAKAEYETIKETSEANAIKVMNDNVFLNEDGKRELELDYMIAEEQFPKFMQLHFEENKKSGLPVYDAERVPEADARDRMIAAENELLKLQLETIPNNLIDSIKQVQNHWKYREQALNLILRLEV